MPGPSSDPQDKLILIADDDEGMREILEFTLRREGFFVESAADGKEALRKIRQLMPSAILLDLNFPHHLGQNILIELQAGASASIPVIVITGNYHDSRTEVLVRQEPNVAGFLEKPVDPTALITLLHRTLNTRPAQAQARKSPRHLIERAR